MNAPIYPQKLQGKTVYTKETESGEWNDEKDDYDEIETVTAATVLGIAADNDGDFHFLVEKDNGELESWMATLCYLEDPR